MPGLLAQLCAHGRPLRGNPRGPLPVEHDSPRRVAQDAEHLRYQATKQRGFEFCQRPGGLLATGAAQQIIDTCQRRRQGELEYPVPRQVGEFEVLSELGRGGMGVVYRAWQPSLGRQVALKCLLPGDAKAEARFTREIRALGKVEHPHLVKVFTSGSEGAQWFYAMELVGGATLAGVCDKLAARSSSAAGVDAQTWQEMLDTACAEARRGERPLSDQHPEGVGGAERSAAPGEGAGPLANSGKLDELEKLVDQALEMLGETERVPEVNRRK